MRPFTLTARQNLPEQLIRIKSAVLWYVMPAVSLGFNLGCECNQTIGSLWPFPSALFSCSKALPKEWLLKPEDAICSMVVLGWVHRVTKVVVLGLYNCLPLPQIQKVCGRGFCGIWLLISGGILPDDPDLDSLVWCLCQILSATVSSCLPHHEPASQY